MTAEHGERVDVGKLDGKVVVVTGAARGQGAAEVDEGFVRPGGKPGKPRPGPPPLPPPDSAAVPA